LPGGSRSFGSRIIAAGSVWDDLRGDFEIEWHGLRQTDGIKLHAHTSHVLIDDDCGFFLDCPRHFEDLVAGVAVTNVANLALAAAASTSRFKRGSRARYTSPMPPEPRGARISYGPRFWPRCGRESVGPPAQHLSSHAFGEFQTSASATTRQLAGSSLALIGNASAQNCLGEDVHSEPRRFRRNHIRSEPCSGDRANRELAGT
jgi:hypothetical protein